jgi:lipopolysaccharide export system permease protein
MFWPRKFTRYVLGDVIQLFVVMLCGLTSLIMLGLVLHHLISAGLGLSAFAQLLPFASVMSLQFAFPAALLFAVCTVYGRLAADNELIALKSVGVSPWSIMKPTLIFALLLSPVAVWMIDLAVSWGSPGMQRVILHSLEETIYRVLRTNRSYTSQAGIAIHVQDIEDRWLIKPTITIYDGENRSPNTTTAERGRISRNAETECLMIELVDYSADNGDRWNFDGGKDTLLIPIPLWKATQKNRATDSASMIPLRQISHKKTEVESAMQRNAESLLTRSSMALASGRLHWYQDELAQRQQFDIRDGAHKLERLQAEPWRRWAQGFSCFCFAWLGVPLAIRFRSADYIATFGVCFLPILLLYYPLFMLGVDKAKGGDWHPASPWIANFVLLAVGGWFTRKVYRE